MIPKIIHYCWFGGKPEPKEVLDCIKSWKKFLPDYKIIRWDESNYDVHKCKYMSDAYKEKKWAFVSDYCRVDVVYTYGGIYLDTDVEVVRSFDSLLSEKMFCGFEIRDPKFYNKSQIIEESVNFGLGYGAEKNHPILKDILSLYDTLKFYNTDGSLNLIACPRYQTQILVSHGLIANGKTQRLDEAIAYSAEYFSPQSNITDEMLNFTVETFSIHHFTSTWGRFKGMKGLKLRLSKILGYHFADIIVRILFYPTKLIWKK